MPWPRGPAAGAPHSPPPPPQQDRRAAAPLLRAGAPRRRCAEGRPEQGRGPDRAGPGREGFPCLLKPAHSAGVGGDRQANAGDCGPHGGDGAAVELPPRPPHDAPPPPPPRPRPRAALPRPRPRRPRPPAALTRRGSRGGRRGGGRTGCIREVYAGRARGGPAVMSISLSFLPHSPSVTPPLSPPPSPFSLVSLALHLSPLSLLFLVAHLLSFQSCTSLVAPAH